MNKKNLKLTLKGILLWAIALNIMLFLCCIESVFNESIILALGIVAFNIILIMICHYIINEKEFMLLSGYNLIDNTVEE